MFLANILLSVFFPNFIALCPLLRARHLNMEDRAIFITPFTVTVEDKDIFNFIFYGRFANFYCTLLATAHRNVNMNDRAIFITSSSIIFCCNNLFTTTLILQIKLLFKFASEILYLRAISVHNAIFGLNKNASANFT